MPDFQLTGRSLYQTTFINVVMRGSQNYNPHGIEKSFVERFINTFASNDPDLINKFGSGVHGANHALETKKRGIISFL